MLRLVGIDISLSSRTIGAHSHRWIGVFRHGTPSFPAPAPGHSDMLKAMGGGLMWLTEG
jgi:hypothetical protein